MNLEFGLKIYIYIRKFNQNKNKKENEDQGLSPTWRIQNLNSCNKYANTSYLFKAQKRK